MAAANARLKGAMMRVTAGVMAAKATPQLPRPHHDAMTNLHKPPSATTGVEKKNSFG